MRSNELRSNELAQQTEARVLEKLDRVLKLLGVMAVKDLSQTAQITMLSRIGFSPKNIAEILGTTSNTVRVALVSIRKAGGHKKKQVIADKQEQQND